MLEAFQTLEKWEILPFIVALGSFEDYVLMHRDSH